MNIEYFYFVEKQSDIDLEKYRNLLFDLSSKKKQIKLSDCILELGDYHISEYCVLFTFKCVYENDTFNRNNTEKEINDFLNKSLLTY